MGIRMTQFMGLTDRARKLVKGEPVLAFTDYIVRVYPDGRVMQLPPHTTHVSSVKSEPSGEIVHGMNDDEFPLTKYAFPDGRIYYEREQHEEWSSGPVIFLALQDERGNWIEESLWAEEGIRACV